VCFPRCLRPSRLTPRQAENERLLAERTQENEAQKTELAAAKVIAVSVFSPLLAPESIDPTIPRQMGNEIIFDRNNKLIKELQPYKVSVFFHCSH
jgi:hypothetical protein